MRLFAADVLKLSRRLATWLSVGLLVGLLLLVFLAIGGTAGRSASPGAQQALAILTFPAAYDAIFAFILGLGGLLAVIYGAAVAGSEWGWGTLKSAVARGESRTLYLLSLFASVALMIAIGILVAFAVGIIAAYVGGRLAGVAVGDLRDAETLSRLPVEFARGWVALLEQAALGFAIATLARSQLAGIGVGIGVYFGESFASIFLPDIVKYLPFNAAAAAASVGESNGGFGGNGVTHLPPDTALLIVLAWLVGSLVVAALATERAEITG
jgi:ABC-type transport system involved in multi-copper enzyme maturation permease subunit